MSLCDPISVLERVNKNIIAEVMDNLDKKGDPLPVDYMYYWKKFVFEKYFPFIFEMAENAFFTNVTVYKKKIVSFKRFTSPKIIDQAIDKKKILVSLYKAPMWFAKSFHQLNDQEKDNSELSDYLYICYNPSEDHGKRVTVSLHIMKTPEQVLDAELDYKQPFTKKTLFGVIATLGSIGVSVANFANVGINFDQLLSFGPLLLVVGLAFIFFDVRSLINNILNGSLNKLVTRHKKTMKKRLDSSHSMSFLQSFYRRIHAIIASTIIQIIREAQENIYINNDFLLKKVQKYLHTDISSFELSRVMNNLLDHKIISINNSMLITLLINENTLTDKKKLDHELVAIFGIPSDLEENLFDLYADFRKIVVEICEIAHLNPPDFPNC